MFNTLRKAAVAAVSVGALLFASTGAAIAAPQDALVDTSKTGNIHLTKYDDAAGFKAPTGTQQTVNANPVDGIEFTLTPITKAPGIANVEQAIGQNDKIADLGKLTAADAAKAKAAGTGTWAFGQDIVRKTANGGKIDFTNLKLGVYLLQETNSTVDGVTYKGAAPSLVYLPTTNPEDQSSWIMDGNNYGVWVYPKNSLEANEKTVVDTNKQVGQTIDYTISATIPGVQKLAQEVDGRTYNLKDFAFFDTLDSKLELADTSSVKVSYGQAAGENQLAAQDFVAVIKDVAGSKKLIVTLTNTGLEKVAAAKAANSTTKVFLTFSPKVIASGIVPNKAIVFKNNGEGNGEITPNNPPNNPPTTPGAGQETNTVVSAWGKIKIVKKDDKGALLKGAEFQVFGVKNGQIKYDDGALNVNGKTTFTTSDNGEVLIDGLHANNLENSKVALGDQQYDEYALVETKAPAGFELNRAPIKFTVKAAQVNTLTTQTTWKLDENGKVISDSVKTTVEENATNISETNVDTLFRTTDVINIPVKPKLPLTGGAGIAVFGIVGFAILAAGVVYGRRKSLKA